MEDFDSILNKLDEDYQMAKNSESGESYSRLSTIFEELNGYMREYIQGLTEDDVEKVLHKLRNGDALSSEDKEIIHLWIVDDAQRYLETENNYEDWQKELTRLMDVILSYRGRKPDINVCSAMRALFRDGSRVISDIFYYLQQKDRVEKFEHASKSFDPQERAILIGLLEQKIKKSEF